MSNPTSLSAFQLYTLVGLCVLTGWYFLYEGIIKLFSPGWITFGFLMSTEGIFSNFFHSLAENLTPLEPVNFFNGWGLITIDIGLITVTLSRIASLSGALLVFLYYLAHPSTIEAQLNLIHTRSGDFTAQEDLNIQIQAYATYTLTNVSPKSINMEMIYS